jgi:hypothetical protein
MLRCLAAASSALRLVLAAPARPAECLGVTRGALYLRIAGPPGALAVLTHDAVRLPCGLVLATTSAELPLTSLARPSPDLSAGFVVGDGAVSWTGPAGPVVVRAAREWAPARPATGEVAASAFAAVCPVVSGAVVSGAVVSGAPISGAAVSGGGLGDVGVSGADRSIFDSAGRSWPLADLGAAASDRAAAAVVAARLLGSGPGLTPSGDDVLAGFLVGAVAFGIDAAELRDATAVLAPSRTTALSAALLWHAARGECIDELAALAAVMTNQRCAAEQAGHAVSRLLSVGHTSGAALALGLVIAAERALHAQAVLAESGLAETVLAETVLAETALADSGRAEAGGAATGRAETGRAA